MTTSTDPGTTPPLLTSSSSSSSPHKLQAPPPSHSQKPHRAHQRRSSTQRVNESYTQSNCPPATLRCITSHRLGYVTSPLFLCFLLLRGNACGAPTHAATMSFGSLTAFSSFHGRTPSPSQKHARPLHCRQISPPGRGRLES
jgi:hypothetical protein